ncbi:MAG: hypothetical protein R3C18_02245 [Planctomycetaceae bacterium]
MRLLLATLAGGAVCYIWGVLAWLALPVHSQTMTELPDEAAVTSALEAQNLVEGVYAVPGYPEMADDATAEDQTAAWEEFTKAHQAGPVYSIYYRPKGMTPMGPDTMGKGFALDLLAAGIAAFIVSQLAANGASFFVRWRTVFVMGLFTCIVAYGALWNWMAFPDRFTIDMMLDVAICWSLVGLVIASIIRTEEKPVVSADSENR